MARASDLTWEKEGTGRLAEGPRHDSVVPVLMITDH
jgi:hypothetical protein